MNNRVTHFEIPSDNPEKAMSSFKEVFGWDFSAIWHRAVLDRHSRGVGGR
jgi:predicted enzyme related to lactoylglutathione lyase